MARVDGTSGNDILVNDTDGGVFSGGGDDTITSHADDNTDTSQIHIYAGDGEDVIRLSFFPISSHTFGHHVRGDRTNDSATRFVDVFNFSNTSNVANGAVVVGRIEDFDASRDTIEIDGNAIDLGNPPSNVRIVEFNGNHNDPGSDPQQWIHIETSGGGHIFYSLEGARVDMNGNGGANDGDQERHFVDDFISGSMTVADLQALPEVDFVDQLNTVPISVSHGSGGVTINDIDESSVDVNRLIQGTSADDAIAAGLNDDRVSSGGGSDSVWGGSGHDRINSGSGNDFVHGGTGDDTIEAGTGNDTVEGGIGYDRMTIAGMSDEVEVLAYYDNGAILIRSVDGDDLLSGIEFINARDEGSFEVNLGTVGADTLTSGRSNWDIMNGGGGNDSIVGAHGADLLGGGSGNDTIEGGGRNDTIDGGSGFDRVNLAGRSEDIEVLSFNDDGSVVVRSDDGDDLLSEIEFINSIEAGSYEVNLGTAGADTLTSTRNNWDLMNGGAGNDQLIGAHGADLLGGGSGNDTIEGGGRNDTIDGGSGFDRVLINDRFDEVEVVTFFDDGSIILRSNDGDDRLSNVEFIDTTLEGAYEVNLGTSGNDTITSSRGTWDLMNGGGGDDLILGAHGADILGGGSGDDTINGGGRADTIVGGLGDDELTGDGGNDIFVFENDFGNDTITDFNGSSAELIDLSDITGVMSISDLTFETSGGSTTIRFDLDGDGSLDADHSITVVGQVLTQQDSDQFIF